MKQLMRKIEFQKHGAIYVTLLGVLSYCLIVLHFAAVYWDAPAKEWYTTSLSNISELTFQGEQSYVTPNGGSFQYTLNGDQLAMVRGSIPLEQGEYLSVSADITGSSGITVYMDLCADGYDNPEQETALPLDGQLAHVEQRWPLGEVHPDKADFRVFAFASSPSASDEGLVLENVRVSVESNGTMFAPVHMPSLVIGILLGLLFLLSLFIYLSGREKEELVIPTAQKGIIYGYLKLKLIPRLKNKSGTMTGNLVIVNKGKPVQNLSGGSYPVNVGISIVDENRTMVNQEYKRVPIKTEGVLGSKEKIQIPISLDDLGEYAGKGYSLAFTLVQEGVAWDRSSAVYSLIP